MFITKLQVGMLIFGGAAIGSGVTMLVLNKHYREVAEEEISSVREYYKAQTDRVDTLKKQNMDLLDVLVEQQETKETKPEKETVTKEQLRDLVDNLGYSSGEEDQVRYHNSSVEDDDRDPNTPYTISVAEFMANDNDYDQITLTYFFADRTLADDSEKAIDDVDEIVGLENLKQFGRDSGNDAIVYIRNERLGSDFEVIRDGRSYSKDVLGIEDWENQPVREPIPRPKKFRNGD